MIILRSSEYQNLKADVRVERLLGSVKQQKESDGVTL